MASSSVAPDWGPPRTANAFTGYVVSDTAPKPAGLVVRFVTHQPLPITLADVEASGQKRIVGTILAFPHLGYAKAPYKKPGKNAPAKRASAADAPTKPLLEVVARAGDGQPLSVRVYSFLKANSNFDKGDRDDECFSELAIGQTLTFFLNEYTFEKEVFHASLSGTIPPYTVIDLILNPSHNQSKGYGIKIARIAPHDSTLYSYMTPSSLGHFISGADSADEVIKARAERCEHVMNCVERSRYGVYGLVSREARVVTIDEGVEFVRIEVPGGDAPVLPGIPFFDIAFGDLQAFTNCPGDVLLARSFVDLAIAAGALRAFVTFDDYYNRTEPRLAQYRGVPLIDVVTFLAPVDGATLEGRACTVFTTDWKVAHEMTLQKIALRVSSAPLSQEAGLPYGEVSVVPPPCRDFPLVSDGCAFNRGYKIHIGNPGPMGVPAGRGDSSFYVLTVYFESESYRGGGGGATKQATSFKRVRIEEEPDAEEDAE